MSFLDDAVSFVSGAANLVGDAVEGAGNLIGAAGDAVGAVGGLLGQALGGVGDLLGALAGPLGEIFPPLGIAMSLGSMACKGIGEAVTTGTKLLQEASQIPKFAAKEMNQLIHTATAQLTGGGQTDPACDAAVKDKWGGQVNDFCSAVQQGFMDNVSNASKSDKKDWIQVLVDGLKGAINDAFNKMDASSQKISGGASASPADVAQFQKDAGFFQLVMSTATQSIHDVIDSAKDMAKTA